MGNKKKLKKKGGRYSKILTPDQIKNFERFGQPDLSQDWLEIFTPDMYDDIRTIMTSCSDNQLKAEYIEKEWSELGFETVGLGTNILTMAHPYYPGVVFKVALDENGIADNFNDFQLSKCIGKFNQVYSRDPAALISVQERLVLPTPYQMDMFMPEILSILSDLSKYFLIADLSPDMRLNYGLTRDGELKIIDGSDLYPLSQMKEAPRCKRIVGEHKHTGEPKYCGNKLKYSKDFKYFVCPECGAKYMTLEMRPKKEVTKVLDLYRDGYNAEEREAMANAELAAICHTNQYESKARSLNGHQDENCEPRTVFVDVDEDDDDIESDLNDQKESMNSQVTDDDRDAEGFTVLKPKTDGLIGDQDTSASEVGEDDKPVDVELPTFDDPEPGEMDNDDTQMAGTDPVGDLADCSVVPAGTPSTDSTVEYDKPNVSETQSLEATQGGQSNTDSTLFKLEIDKEDENVKNFLALCDHLKHSSDPLEASMYQGFVTFVSSSIEKVLNDSVGDIQTQDTEDSPTVLDENPSVIDLGERAYDMLAEIKDSADPRGSEILANICKAFYIEPDQPDVEKEITNNDNTGESDGVIRPTEPHCWYRVVNDTCDENDTQLFPGIFMEISGDFREAFDNNGLSLYISFADDPSTSYKAISASTMEKLMETVVLDAQAERIENHLQNNTQEEEDNNPAE